MFNEIKSYYIISCVYLQITICTSKIKYLPISFPHRLGMRFIILKHDGSSLHKDLANKQLRLPVGVLSSEKKNNYINENKCN